VGRLSLVDLAVYMGIFRWWTDYLLLDQDVNTAKRLMMGGVWARAVLLALLVVVFLRARTALSPRRRQLEQRAWSSEKAPDAAPA
jgi:hypothetical protein